MLRSRAAATAALPLELGLLCRLPRSYRYLSTTAASSPSSSSASQSFLEFDQLPCFPVRGKDLKVLYEPQDFYSTLLKGIKKAKKRIFLATLYIGKEETELIQAIHSALQANDQLEVHFLADYLRSTREHPQGASSASLVAALQAAFPLRVHVSLYHTPALSGLLKKIVPKRYNEGWGLWHGKFYGFDDDIVVSGANLSRDYFTNRQDRYLHIRGHAPLAKYFHDLIRHFGSLSYQLHGFSTAAGPANFDLKWFTTSGLPAPTSDSKGFTEGATEVLRNHMTTYLSKPRRVLSSPSQPVSDLAGMDTLIQPFLQMGAFGIRQETDHVMPAVLNKAASSEDGTTLDWTSGYFSVHKQYREALLRSKAPVRIVCASPEANGFYQSKGFSKYIPPAYTYLEGRFWEAIKAGHKQDNIELTEWKREGWTYHSKGIWLSSKNNLLTLIGSSNYGYRSAVRDMEVNLAIQTTSPELKQALNQELTHIREHATDKVNDALFERPERKVGIINRFAARTISNML